MYGAAVAVRNWLYDLKILKSTQFDLPVICVGNVAVGGTGKTPTVEFLVDKLGDQYTIAVLSRGYRRRTKGYREVQVGDTQGDAWCIESGLEPGERVLLTGLQKVRNGMKIHYK